MKILARDNIDIEHLDYMVNTTGWKMFAARVSEMIASEMQALEGDLDPTQTAQTRGFLRGVRRCMEIPQILRNEVKDRQKEAKR